MPKCPKVKNPCKICLGQVTTKNGLQCQGACKTWMHFDCLNYTPGKVRDIKAGVIKVTCPCPDCKSTGPREYRSDVPFSCRNSYCPANQLPKCDNQVCPINFNVTPELRPEHGCALSKCGHSCKKNSVPHLPDRPQPPPLPPCKPAQSYSMNSRCNSCSDIPGDHGPIAGPDISLNTLQQMCNTIGQLSNQLNSLMTKMKQNTNEKKGANCGKLGCSPRGSKTNCPKPCNCPGNTRR